MPPGTYTLVIALETDSHCQVGALGERSFPAGAYAYTGSAFGPGGLARVDRHRELATGDRETRHWHIDYLLGESAASIETVVTTEDRDVECAVARAIDAPSVPGFGASDCDCDSHLARGTDTAALVAAVRAAHEAVR